MKNAFAQIKKLHAFKLFDRVIFDNTKSFDFISTFNKVAVATFSIKITKGWQKKWKENL